MTKKTTPPLGDFALFGFSQNPASLLDKFRRLDITPRMINFGAVGSFYFYATYGDIVETDELVCLKLGFARTPDINPLTTNDLLTKKLMSPRGVEQDKLRGSAMLACLSKTAPEFTVYQTLLAVPQLYYTADDGDILCASSQRCLVALLDRVELNEEILPFHFLFQLAPGPLTYFRNVYRLFPGQSLRWRTGQWQVEYIKDLRFTDNQEYFERIDARSTNIVYERLSAVTNAYLDQLAGDNQEAGNLLSGGVDSAIIQLVINDRSGGTIRPKSYSYAVQVPGFAFEVEYAREASRLLNTDHVIADIWPDDFPGIISRAIETVAQPIPAEADACKIALVEFLASQPDAPRFFLAGHGADAVYGIGLARKLALFEMGQKVPAAGPILKMLAGLVQPGAARLADGLQAVARALLAVNNPQSFDYWPNLVYVYTNLDIARRSFGDAALFAALAYRNNLEKQFLGSPNLTEQLHVIDFLTNAYEPANLSNQMFLAHRKEQIYPYLDEDIIRIAHAFNPQVRYLKSRFGFSSRRHIKPLLKQILSQKSYGAIAAKRKGGSAFDTDVFVMMKSGPLREMAHAINRPGFLSQADFQALLERPDHFLWNLLTFDIFQKKVLKQG